VRRVLIVSEFMRAIDFSESSCLSSSLCEHCVCSEPSSSSSQQPDLQRRGCAHDGDLREDDRVFAARCDLSDSASSFSITPCMLCICLRMSSLLARDARASSCAAWSASTICCPFENGDGYGCCTGCPIGGARARSP